MKQKIDHRRRPPELLRLYKLSQMYTSEEVEWLREQAMTKRTNVSEYVRQCVFGQDEEWKEG